MPYRISHASRPEPPTHEAIRSSYRPQLLRYQVVIIAFTLVF